MTEIERIVAAARAVEANRWRVIPHTKNWCIRGLDGTAPNLDVEGYPKPYPTWLAAVEGAMKATVKASEPEDDWDSRHATYLRRGDELLREFTAKLEKLLEGKP